MQKYQTDDTIFALATGWIRSALAIVRISGDGCIALFSRAFSRPEALLKAKGSTIVHGFLKDGRGQTIDEVVVSVYRDGHGYTGEEALELTSHGSPIVIRRILAALGSLGMRQAERGEFTYRAFLHQKMDLTQAEAVEELVDSVSEQGQQMALDRLCGSLKARLLSLREAYLSVMAAIEVQLDYSEDELDAFVFPQKQLDDILTELHNLSATYQVGRLYGNGAKVVLAGRTNVGKSSLFNLLLKEQRSIVSPTPGTTRDYIEENCVIDDVPVRLFDTAGLRESSDAIEKEGIGRTRNLMKDADLVIYLLEDGDAVPPSDDRTLVVWSKSDVKRHEGLSVSSLTGEGIPQLLQAIGTKLRSDLPHDGAEDIVVQSERQHALLEETIADIRSALELEAEKVPLDIISATLQEGLRSLGEITGEVTSEDILDKIFSGFCVGK